MNGVFDDSAWPSGDEPILRAKVMLMFAAHAPAEIPDWVQLDNEPKIEPILTIDQTLSRQPEWREMAVRDKDSARVWMLDACYEPEEDPSASSWARVARRAMDERNESIKRFESDQKELQARRYFAWRWQYANGMLMAAPEELRLT